MNREDIIRMVREAGFVEYELDDGTTDAFDVRYERLAALVEAHVNAKEKERQRYDIHSCGPDCDRYICVAVRNEREACAKMVDCWETREGEHADAIRARGNT